MGTCAIVLHTHLPWLAHHGTWPVGEEWLYQAWAESYLPLVGVLDELAAEGRRDLLTLGISPVLAAMLDAPHCLRGFHTWLGTWALRAEGAAVRGLPTAGYEGRLAQRALARFEGEWRHGASPLIRRLADAGVVELLGGPATHTFTPFLPEPLARFALDVGLDDAALRWGRRPAGIWAPECAYQPGLEEVYASHGVERFVVDGPMVGGDTGAPVDVAGSGVLAFPRDLAVTYRVWSPRRGYPGAPDYRDFHTFDHDSGLRPSRVTSRSTPPERKRPYDPARAAQALDRDAADFVARVRARALTLPQRDPLIVVAYDTELFGHWWHEGPAFLSRVLRLLPVAGIALSTLAAASRSHRPVRRDIPAGSWGSGKDFRVWQTPAVRALQDSVCDRMLAVAAKRVPDDARNATHDQLARETLLCLASDWAFNVGKDTAAGYAWERLEGHAGAVRQIAGPLEAGDNARADRAAARSARRDDPFGHLDSRVLARLLRG